MGMDQAFIGNKKGPRQIRMKRTGIKSINSPVGFASHEVQAGQTCMPAQNRKYLRKCWNSTWIPLVMLVQPNAFARPIKLLFNLEYVFLKRTMSEVAQATGDQLVMQQSRVQCVLSIIAGFHTFHSFLGN